VAILLAVFYLFYRLLMERETFHRLNRAIILLSVLASFVLPLCIITTHQVVQVPESTNQVQEIATVQAGRHTFWPLLLLAIYIVGMVVKLGHTILCTYKLVRLINSCEMHPQNNGTSIAVSSLDIAPFSWWNTIVVSRRDYEQHNVALLAHEKVHICSYHSLDILLMELVTALQWFNPAVWLIGSEIRSVHEYEADASVLANGTDIHQYLSLLMERANLYGGYSITNHISQKQLKGRFLMMARRHSSPSKVFKVLFLLPIIIGTLAVNARTIVDIEIVRQPPVVKPKVTQQEQQPVVKEQPVQKVTQRRQQQQPVSSQEDASAQKEITVSGTVVD
jgi:beta-lactamase regulating signal transducer with metallopeptidase domain